MKHKSKTLICTKHLDIWVSKYNYDRHRIQTMYLLAIRIWKFKFCFSIDYRPGEYDRK